MDFVVSRASAASEELEQACSAHGVDLFSLDADTYDKLADAQTPQPAFAVVHAPSLDIDQRFDASGSLYLVLVDVGDPGNVGTLIRTAEAAGCRGVIVTSTTADVLSPKVVRSSAGSILRMPIGEVNVRELPSVLQRLGTITVATAMDGEPFTDLALDVTQSVAILLGSEAHGLDPMVAAHADKTVAIPMHGKVESLNVAVAGAILLYGIGVDTCEGSL